MKPKFLQPKARLAIVMMALYNAAEALCAIFVGVYLWINGWHDFSIVYRHYLALYMVYPFVFLLSGWYAQARDRLHVYRLGLALHALYYLVLLTLRERSAEFAAPLGALLGLAWGTFYPGANTFHYDVSAQGQREYYIGLLQATMAFVRLVAPLVGGLLIYVSGSELRGYHWVFALALAIYVACFAASFGMPPDATRRPFRIGRALFPGRDQRDWQLILAAALTMAGSYHIFSFFLALLMFYKTGDALSAGGYASFQGVIGVVAAYVLGRTIVPENRRPFMRWGMILLVSAGVLAAWKLSVATLIGFALLRSVAAPMFGIAHFSLRLDTITHSAENPAQRIEYLCAWEVPLAIGRIAMLGLMMVLYTKLPENDLALRLALLALCAVRIATYNILAQTSALRKT